MQELHDDFGVYPNVNTRFNSTIIDDDDNIVEHEDCHMEDDDGVEIFPVHSTSSINEKCLLDELLQTEEVKRNLNIIFIQTHPSD
jgi:cellulose biosynthesis protein BcsQ